MYVVSAFRRMYVVSAFRRTSWSKAIALFTTVAQGFSPAFAALKGCATREKRKAL